MRGGGCWKLPGTVPAQMSAANWERSPRWLLFKRDFANPPQFSLLLG